MLDAGAMGVIVPLVNTAEEARRAVAAAKYPPMGVRGFAFGRMNDHGMNFDEYTAKANDNVAVVVMAESKEAVANIDAILAVDGVDGAFIGPYDLSGSYGMPGQTGHELVEQGCRAVAAACRKAGKSAGRHVVNPTQENISKAIADGFTFIGLGMDTVFLDQAGRAALAGARAYRKGRQG
jgi:2-keto-3-deoxy-L-rhamnonate aldolase RhmA